jgi:hypothetical protein
MDKIFIMISNLFLPLGCNAAKQKKSLKENTY